MTNNQKGFSAVEVLLILVFVGIVGAAGWYVTSSRNDDSNSDTGLTEQSTREYKDYEDDSVKLTYPTDWVIERQDNKNLPGTKIIVATSPASTLPVDTPEEVSLELKIFLNDNDGAENGCGICPILHEVIELNNPGLPGAKLLFTEAHSPNNSMDNIADTLALTVGDNVKAGDKGYEGMRVNGKHVDIYTEIVRDSTQVMVNFTDVDELKSTQTYKDILGILNTLNIK